MMEARERAERLHRTVEKLIAGVVTVFALLFFLGVFYLLITMSVKVKSDDSAVATRIMMCEKVEGTVDEIRLSPMTCKQFHETHAVQK